jgi:hypothetical protein
MQQRHAGDYGQLPGDRIRLRANFPRLRGGLRGSMEKAEQQRSGGQDWG